jgi:hypothetical protein
MKPTTKKEDVMSDKKTDNRCQAQPSNPLATLAECVGTAIVAIAMVPVTIVDAVLSSAVS